MSKEGPKRSTKRKRITKGSQSGSILRIKAFSSIPLPSVSQGQDFKSVPQTKKTQSQTSSATPGMEAPSTNLADHDAIVLKSAPTDPMAFAWWSAQQIKQLDNSGNSDSQGLTAQDGSSDGTANAQNSNASMDPQLEQAHIREKARERQRRWRADNREKSWSLLSYLRQLNNLV